MPGIDCTQHVLDGPLNVCTGVWLMNCLEWSVFRLPAWTADQRFPGWATQAKAILLKNGFTHLSLCCHVAFLSPTLLSVLSSCPTVNKSTSAWKCLLLGCWDSSHEHLLSIYLAFYLTLPLVLLDVCANI